MQLVKFEHKNLDLSDYDNITCFGIYFRKIE